MRVEIAHFGTAPLSEKVAVMLPLQIAVAIFEEPYSMTETHKVGVQPTDIGTALTFNEVNLGTIGLRTRLCFRVRPKGRPCRSAAC